MIFAAYFILRGRDTHIDFLRLFLVGVICPLMQEQSFIAAKKAHQSCARRRHVLDQKTCLQAII